MRNGLWTRGQATETTIEALHARAAVKLAAEQAARDQEIARQQALIDEKTSIAESIVHDVLSITMLGENFQLTEVMG
jgi:hypothetical protein